MGRITDYRELAQKLKPYITPWIVAQGNSQAASPAAGSLAVHALNGAYHSGTLAQSQAPWAVTDDEFATHTSNPDAHHARQHAITSTSDHTVTGSQWQLVGLTGTDTIGLLTPSTDVSGPAAAILRSTDQGAVTIKDLYASQALRYTAFASGFAGAGWAIGYDVTDENRAAVETDDLIVRGRMRVYELLIQQIRATNGSVYVTSSSKVTVVASSTNPSWTVNGSQLTLNGSNATLTFALYTISTSTAAEDSADRRTYHGFLTGDVIRAQQVEWNGSAFAGVTQSNLEVTSVVNLYQYKAAYVGGDAPAIGFDYVRLGNALDSTRQGTVYITSDDSAAPFIDIVDGVADHSQWNTAGKIKARLGKLSGITDTNFGGALSGYGLYADNVYLRGYIIATSGTFTGTVTAGSGAIGGWSISSTALVAGTGSTTVGLDSGGSNPALYAGSATPGSAPFRVTAAGAMTATSATITGAITATSGSLDGFLTLGSSGGIYQGTGTSGSPTTGLKIWNDSGIGRIAGYNGGNLQWFGSTTGYLYAGRNDANSTSYGSDRWGLRLARDGMRLIAEANTSFDQKASTSAIRWIFNSTHDIDAALDTSTSFVSLYAYNNTSSNIVYSGLTTFVGSGAYTAKDSTVYLSAQHYTGSVYHGVDFTLTTVKSTGATYAYCNADEFQLTKALKFDEMTAPAAPAANGVYIYAEDNGAGKTRLMAKFASGAAQQIAIQP